MPVIRYRDMKLTDVEMPGAESVTKANVVAAGEGWDRRVFRIEPGGHTPKHQHDWEHINHIISGRGKLLIGDVVNDLSAKDFAVVPPNTEHQFSNPYDEPFEFICIVPNKGEY